MKRRDFLLSATAATAAMTIGTARAQAPKRYRACVIGDSNDGGYGHSLHLMWGLRDDVDVVALADPDEAGRAKHAAEAKSQRTYADYREMLDTESPDLVAIGPRTTHRHREYLMACIGAGAHGIIEKPLAVDLAEADEVVDAARAKDLRWAMAFNFRASPMVQHARRQIMEERLLGEVLEIRCRGKEDNRAGGEDLIVMGTHCCDMMAFFLGKPQWCSAQFYDDGHASVPADIREATEPLGPIYGTRVHAMWGFGGGVTGYFSSMQNPDGNRGQWGVDIIGSKGVATIRMEAIPRIAWWPQPALTPGGGTAEWKPLPDAPAIAPGGSPVWHYRPIIDDLIAAIEEKREPVVSIDDGRTALEMVQAAFAAHHEKRTLTIPLEEREHPLER
jgi:predicted dehydrogenase